MSTIHYLREGMNNTLDTIIEGWQKLYHQARDAMIHFRPGSRLSNDSEPNASKDVSTHPSKWGVMAADVIDDDDKIIVRLECPGMDKDNFDLQVIDDLLLIRGEKYLEREHDKGQYHITERAFGRFERRIPLPDNVNADLAKAKYKRGVLQVELPKHENQKRNRITISSE